MNILIIGSKGFIGSHIYNFLRKEHNVYGADILVLEEQNYFAIDKESSSFEFLFERISFDLCINASGNGSVPISMSQPMLDFELNVLNTLKILEAVRKLTPTCIFINLSSAAVYGNPDRLPIVESNIGVPLSPYGWHKLNSEQLCQEYTQLFNLKTISLRLFSVYGENLKKQIFWDIFQKTKQSNEISLFGTGNETRDFIYIEDLLEALNCVIRNSTFSGDAVNVASGVEITIKQASQLFCKYLGDDIEVTFNNQVREGDPLKWKADISKLTEMGFFPKYNIESGIKRIASWYLENK